jgi:hypothetical protein
MSVSENGSVSVRSTCQRQSGCICARSFRSADPSRSESASASGSAGNGSGKSRSWSRCGTENVNVESAADAWGRARPPSRSAVCL